MTDEQIDALSHKLRLIRDLKSDEWRDVWGMTDEEVNRAVSYERQQMAAIEMGAVIDE